MLKNIILFIVLFSASCLADILFLDANYTYFSMYIRNDLTISVVMLACSKFNTRSELPPRKTHTVQNK